MERREEKDGLLYRIGRFIEEIIDLVLNIATSKSWLQRCPAFWL
jgi:hypothetical protein